MKYYLALILGICLHTSAYSQLFIKITDSSNPIASASGASGGSYTGCAWIDYDNDNWQDLFWVQGGLFHNDAGTGFTNVTGSNLSFTAGIGTSWSDYDNDGYIDCAIATGFGVGSTLYHNNGDGTFTKINSAPFNTPLQLRAWSCAWGDVNNDTYTDLVFIAPLGFAGITDKNKFLLNDGDGSFTKLDTLAFTAVTAPYTVGTWSDYDQDGDIDLFIGSGPANGTVAPDYLYRNQLSETSTPAYFTKITTPLIATSLVDGQVWNWIDYDNDGDLDAYLTNYVGTSGGTGMANNLYQNDGDGSFTKLTSDVAGPIVSDNAPSLGNLWADFDNDGDLDCLVTNDGTHCEFYYNDNDGSFTKDGTEAFVTSDGFYYGSSAADYDRDGDLDLFISAVGSDKGLFNNTASLNGNHWINFALTGGEASNRNALGTKVKAKATIGGNTVWQYREISAQNAFGSMSSLDVHFGLGDAGKVDSLILIWPSGNADTCTDITANVFYDIMENDCYVPTAIMADTNASGFTIQLSPNPASDQLQINLSLKEEQNCIISLSDISGKFIEKIFTGNLSEGDTILTLDLKNKADGLYIVELNNGRFHTTKTFTIMR